ncbi:MAG: hypothetical protein E6I16_07420 [Chloroflexi bacterium]|nr:MAG: hypothetical protein E6I16_07420 [Chloroflexota bacterium]
MILNRGNFFSFLVTAFVGAVFLLMAFETWALFTGNKPISDYFREAVHAFPAWAFIVAVLVGIALGHFLWGPATGPLAPAPRHLRELMGRRAAN